MPPKTEFHAGFFRVNLGALICVNQNPTQRSDRTPNPGPVGGSVRLVSPPNGSAANLPLLGPFGGTLPARRSFRISSMSLTVRSS